MHQKQYVSQPLQKGYITGPTHAYTLNNSLNMYAQLSSKDRGPFLDLTLHLFSYVVLHIMQETKALVRLGECADLSN